MALSTPLSNLNEASVLRSYLIDLPIINNPDWTEVEINNGTNEMTYLSRHHSPVSDASEWADSLIGEYSPKVTYWDPEKKIYVYDRSIPPFVYNAAAWGPHAAVAMEIDVLGNATLYNQTFFQNKMESVFPLAKVTAGIVEGGCTHPICNQYRLGVEFLFDNHKESAAQAEEFISSYKLEELNGLLADDNIYIRHQVRSPFMYYWCPHGYMYDRYYSSGMAINVYCEAGALVSSILWDFGCDD